MYDKIQVATPGQAANLTTAGLDLMPYGQLAFMFTMDVASGTPSATWKIQGSLLTAAEGDVIPQWNDALYITPASDTPVATAITRTTVGADVIFLDNTLARKYRKFRLVVSGVTATVSYHCDAFRSR